ncbi:MAG: ABC transporter permease [Edaphobacter sp.]|uniref:ABC transporter permease n=1 Tax=Edaphobacter sp. TaxID=1934404 RepID=UPI00238ECCBE|nr:ABC transporter permease [Edaphobacter sp.]MDE1178636.1 ABC transporter permease [Edaphobacter sp.]
MDTLRETLRLWTTRLRMIFRRSDTDFDDELAFHIEQETAQHIARGMSPDEARRQAMIAFGSLSRTRQHSREVSPMHWLEIFLQDVRYALRGFSRSRSFTITTIVILALGIGATTAVLSVVDRILFRTLPYTHADRLVSVGLVHSMETEEFMLGGFYYDWRRNQQPFEAMTSEGAVTRECDLTEGNPAQLSCPTIEVNYLPTFGVSPVLGRNFLPEEGRPGGPNVALISYGLWLRHYNRDPSVLNRTIEIDGKPVRVIGVLPRDFEMPRLQEADVIFPMTMDEAADRKSNEGIGSPKRVFARLKPGVTVEQAYAQLGPLFEQTQKWIPAEIRADFHLRIRSLRDRQMQNVHSTAWVLLGTVFAVLLIACANVASLLMARGAVRQRELAVRSALGASRARLIRQALTEALLLSAAGAIAGTLLAQGLLRVFIALSPASIPYIHKAQLDLRIISFTVVLSLISGLVFGLIPALQRPREDVLTGRSVTSTSHAAIRQWLVVIQLAMSVVLLTGAALLLRSFWSLQSQQLGMREDNTVTASITLGARNYSTPVSKMNFFQLLATRLRFGPGISVVSVSDSLPPADGHDGVRYGEIFVSGRPRTIGGEDVVVKYRLISPDYFRALDISMVQGEGFHEEDLNSNDRFVVLSQRLAEMLFPSHDAIGKRLNFNHVNNPNAPWYTVIGVAANVKNGGLSGEQMPEYYHLRRNREEDWAGHGVWGPTSLIVVRSSLTTDETAKWIRAQVSALDPTIPVDIATLKQRVSKLADQPRFATVLVGFFAATGLLMAVIGLYGVIAYLVTQREREIGVRMALGASRESILRMILGRSLRLIVCGAAVGLCAALGLSHLLRSMLYDVGPHDPFSYTIVLLLLAATGMMASLLPARSATQVDPATVLRSE